MNSSAIKAAADRRRSSRKTKSLKVPRKRVRQAKTGYRKAKNFKTNLPVIFETCEYRVHVDLEPTSNVPGPAILN